MRFAVRGREVRALDRISMDFPPGSFTTIVGRSGCGKTTLLRLLAGLQSPDTGSLRHGAQDRIGYVFQEPRLMPWLTVRRNVGFGLGREEATPDAADRIASVLARVGLTGFADAYPAQLSGGMASRVAIARALVLRPTLLLLDEPFAALDAFTRRDLQGELVRLWRADGPTVVFITHDVEEAVLLGQRVAQMEHGRLTGIHEVPLPYPRDATDAALLPHRRAVLHAVLHETTPVLKEPAS